MPKHRAKTNLRKSRVICHVKTLICLSKTRNMNVVNFVNGVWRDVWALETSGPCSFAPVPPDLGCTTSPRMRTPPLPSPLPSLFVLEVLILKILLNTGVARHGRALFPFVSSPWSCHEYQPHVLGSKSLLISVTLGDTSPVMGRWRRGCQVVRTVSKS